MKKNERAGFWAALEGRPQVVPRQETLPLPDDDAPVSDVAAPERAAVAEPRVEPQLNEPVEPVLLQPESALQPADFSPAAQGWTEYSASNQPED